MKGAVLMKDDPQVKSETKAIKVHYQPINRSGS